MKNQKIILLTGRPGAGKSTAGDILRQNFGLRVANVGDLLESTLTNIGIHCSNRAEIGPLFLATFPPSAIFEIIKKAIFEQGIAVFDGVRLQATCVQIQNWNRETQIWHVEAPGNTRISRLRQRAAHMTDQEHLDFLIAQYAIYDNEEASIIKSADVILDNSQDILKFNQLIVDAYINIKDI